MRLRFPARIETILVVLMMCSAGLLALKAGRFMLYYAIQNYLLEYREYAVILSTDLLLKGLNPYAIELQPLAMNVYGIVYNLLVLPFAMLFGSSPAIHRIVSSFFVIAASGLLLWGLRASRVSWSMSFVGAITFFAFLATGYSMLSRPDGLGEFLLLAGIVVPFVLRFSVTGLILSVLLSMLGFFTKPYFILGAPFLAAYLFVFESKIKGLLYSLAVALSLLLLIPIVHALCETWLTNTIFNHINNDVSGQYTSVEHLRVQLWYHVQTLSGFIIALFWGIGYRAATRQGSMERVKRPLFNVRELGRPLVTAQGDLPLFMCLCGLAILVFKLGLHTGNGQLYYHQLVAPFFLWFAVKFLDGLRDRSNWAVAVPITINLLALCHYYVPGDLVDYKPQWKALEQAVTHYRDIYHSPGLAYVMKRSGKPVYNTGHNEYYAAGIPYNFTSTTDRYARQGDSFWRRIDEKARRKQLDLVMLDAGAAWPIDRNVLMANYDLVAQTYMPLLFNGSWPLEVWIPKSGH
jgi:hypothetical protein